MKYLPLKLTAAVLTSALLLAGCNSDTKYRYIETSSSADGIDKNMAVVSTVGPNDASFALIDLGQSPLHAVEDHGVTTGATDYDISAYGKHFYHIGKYQIDTIAKYAIDNPTKQLWKFSTSDNANDPTNNPLSLVFVNEEKAYLIRYDSDKLWVVNPSAKKQDDFKIGEIDLNHYNDGGNLPRMEGGLIIDGKLYLMLQRLDAFYSAVADNSYIAVYDIETDTEVDTRPIGSTATLKGIQLKTSNPFKLKYHKDIGLLVQSFGSYGSDEIGGIEKINLNDYSTSIVLSQADDGYQFDDLAIINANKAYFSQYNGWEDNDLCSFDPSASDVSASIVCNIASIQNQPISNLTVDYQNRLWVSISDNNSPRITLIDPATDVVIQTVNTNYNPGTVLISEPESVYKFKQ